DYLDGELDDAGGEQLCTWLNADSQHVQTFVRHVFLHRQLREAMMAENIAKCLKVSTDSPPKTEVMPVLEAPNVECQRFWSYLPIVLALLFGVVTSSVVTWQIAARWFDTAGDRVAIGPSGKANWPRHGAAPYVATLVNVTNCRWDQAFTTADLKQ